MNRLRLLPMIIAAMAAFGPVRGSTSNKPKRPCLVCDKPHDHNNSFCSADCCKLHRAAKQ